MTAVDPGQPATITARCPSCGAERIEGATFCEACAFDFGHGTMAGSGGAGAEVPGVEVPGVDGPGNESPLDVGWTGIVATDEPTPGTGSGRTAASETAETAEAVCGQCGQGHFEDGYCNQCGAKQPDPRDHFTEAPATWVAGVCDIGRRHRRNEDAMALTADEPPLSFAALVVCDGVSNSTDSHIASLAAGRAARDVLREPMPRGVGTRAAVVAAAQRRLDDAVRAAQAAVLTTTAAAGDEAVASPPSCTFVAALVVDGVAVTGNVGDSRAYWLPDDTTSPARQLGADDSFAAAQISSGMSRLEAETSPGAHAITRWLGVDSPEDLTPNSGDLDLTEDGWLLVCSDGLWNYWSEPDDLRTLVHGTVTALAAAGLHPPTVAQALTDHANEAGGADNITVTLARVGAVAPAPAAPPPETPAPPRALDQVSPHTDATPDPKDSP